ncbi:MAG: zinc-binding dehydrogenase [Planctomycetes bacterium]|nr:zinc-binding dehydrogenase [Planctomycetota bacterium]
MRAVVYRRHGGPEVVSSTTLPRPEPGPGEALVAVAACALNHLDLWVRAGLPGVTVEMPHVPGSEIAGAIAALGPGVRGWEPGEPVLVAPGLSCGECPACREGDDTSCARFDILGFRRDGGFAEFARVPARNLRRRSTRLTPVEWAAVPLTFLTAWRMLSTLARTSPGEWVLVMGAGSGVGVAAIQIARHLGARVIAASSSDAKVEKAKALGAEAGVNYASGSFAPHVREITGGRGADVVVEHTGGSLFVEALRSLARRGRLVTCGATSGGTAPIEIRSLYVNQQVVLGSYMGGRRELEEVLSLVEEGKLKPVVDSVFPLERAAEALARMERRENFGKIVLEVSP